jgi:hypothetical protein
MWQSPNKRQGSNKRRADRLKGQLHIQRVEGHVKSLTTGESPEAGVRVLLNDFSIKGIGLFANQKLNHGQDVELSLSEPHPIKVRGRIVWCQEQDSGSHILSKTPYSFRAGIEFQPRDKSEEEQLKAYQDTLVKDGILKGP